MSRLAMAALKAAQARTDRASSQQPKHQGPSLRVYPSGRCHALADDHRQPGGAEACSGETVQEAGVRSENTSETHGRSPRPDPTGAPGKTRRTHEIPYGRARRVTLKDRRLSRRRLGGASGPFDCGQPRLSEYQEPHARRPEIRMA